MGATKPLSKNLPSVPQLKGDDARKAKGAYLLVLVTQKFARTSDALVATGITLNQLEKWRDTDPEFCSMERQAALALDDLLRKRIDEMVADGNEKIILGAMKRLPEYNQMKQTTVNVRGKVQHEHLIGRPEGELDAIIRSGADLIDAEYEEVESDQGTDEGAIGVGGETIRPGAGMALDDGPDRVKLGREGDE